MASLLKTGSSGDEVRQLQELLNQYGGYGLQVDGQYGALTQYAVRQYRLINGMN